jgi:hypothetical protein
MLFFQENIHLGVEQTVMGHHWGHTRGENRLFIQDIDQGMKLYPLLSPGNTKNLFAC